MSQQICSNCIPLHMFPLEFSGFFQECFLSEELWIALMRLALCWKHYLNHYLIRTEWFAISIVTVPLERFTCEELIWIRNRSIVSKVDHLNSVSKIITLNPKAILRTQPNIHSKPFTIFGKSLILNVWLPFE